MSTRILVVDDEDTLRGVISQVLEEDGYDVTDAASGEKALELFRQAPYPIVVTDIIMERMSGLELLQEVKLLDPETLVILMTSQGSLDRATAALRAGAYDFLTKPFEELEVISTVVRRACERLRLVEQNRSLMVDLREHAAELERVNKSLEDQAIHDELTGLHNYRYFRDALQREISRSRRHEREFSLAFMDVDHFKEFNDTYGHLAGDQALKELARILKGNCRASTTLARDGGEEFVAVLPELSKEQAIDYAELVRSRAESHSFRGPDGRELATVTISLGVATFPGDGEAAESLIAQADQMLYEAKKNGRNRVCG